MDIQQSRTPENIVPHAEPSGPVRGASARTMICFDCSVIRNAISPPNPTSLENVAPATMGNARSHLEEKRAECVQERSVTLSEPATALGTKRPRRPVRPSRNLGEMDIEDTDAVIEFERRLQTASFSVEKVGTQMARLNTEVSLAMEPLLRSCNWHLPLTRNTVHLCLLSGGGRQIC